MASPPTTLIDAALPGMRDAYWDAIWATIYGKSRDEQDDAWQKFQDALLDSLRAVDLVSAERLRYRAGMSPLTASAMADMEMAVRLHPWAGLHAERTEHRLEDRAEMVAKAERDFYHESREKLAAQQPGAVPVNRMQRAWRMSQWQVRADAEQITLADPVVGGQFPAVEYRTRDDSRVRETHALMNKFRCARSWEHYDRVIPPAGFGCRCSVVPLSWHELITIGLATRDHRLKFQVRWPSEKARRNFDRGIFPDEGFQHKRIAAKKVTTPRQAILGVA